MPRRTKKATKKGPRPAVGQIWVSTDPRYEGRRFQVQIIEGDRAFGVTAYPGQDTKRAKLRVSRLNPNGGWRLLDTVTANEPGIPTTYNLASEEKV